MRAINPYIVGNPVKDQASFYGRQDIFREVMQVLHQRDSHAIVLYGQRRIGKTSMLLQLEQRLAKEGEFTPVYFDLQDKASKSLPELLYEIAQHISRVTGHTVQQAGDFGSTGDYFRDTFLPAIAEKSASSGLVLLLDEFDVLDSPARTQASQAFFPYLRTWMENVQKVKFVFVIGRRPEELSLRSMATFKGIQSTRVSFMSQKDTEAVVRQSEQAQSLTWEAEAIASVYDLTHGHPYFTQLLCSVVWENNHEDDDEDGDERNPIATAEEVDKAVDQALKMGANAFNWLWDGLPPAERVIMSAMAEVKDEIITQEQLIESLNQSGVRLIARELELAPDTLMDWELLYRVDAGYRFAVPLLRHWVQANRPLRRVKDELDRLDPLADTLFQGGQGFYNSGRLTDAEQQLRQALNINPNHLKARLLLGRVYLDQNKLAESIEVLEAAYQYDERAARADLLKSLLALVESQSADENKQLETCERVLAIQPDQPVARERRAAIWVRRGDAAFDVGEFDLATKAYEIVGHQAGLDKVIAALREQNWQDNLRLANAFVAGRQFKEALDTYDKLMADYPEKQETIKIERERARTTWRDSRISDIPIYVEEEKWEKVIETCEPLLNEFPNDEVISAHLSNARSQLTITSKYLEALGALQSGMRDQARKLFTEIVAENPSFGRASLRLVEAMYGKVRISLPVPLGATLLTFINSLLWTTLSILFLAGWPLQTILIGMKENNGWDYIYTESLLLYGLIAIPLVGMLFNLYANSVISVSHQIERGKPLYPTALWTHALFGMGLFYVAHEKRRKWVYSFVALLIPLSLLARIFYLVPISEFSPLEEINFVSIFQFVLIFALIAHALSFIDVLIACRQKRVARPRTVPTESKVHVMATDVTESVKTPEVSGMQRIGWRQALVIWWPVLLFTAYGIYLVFPILLNSIDQLKIDSWLDISLFIINPIILFRLYTTSEQDPGNRIKYIGLTSYAAWCLHNNAVWNGVENPIARSIVAFLSIGYYLFLSNRFSQKTGRVSLLTWTAISLAIVSTVASLNFALQNNSSAINDALGQFTYTSLATDDWLGQFAYFLSLPSLLAYVLFTMLHLILATQIRKDWRNIFVVLLNILLPWLIIAVLREIGFQLAGRGEMSVPQPSIPQYFVMLIIIGITYLLSYLYRSKDILQDLLAKRKKS